MTNSIEPSFELISAPNEPFRALATADFFFHNGDLTPVALLDRQGILFLPTEEGRAANAKRDALLAARQAAASTRENIEAAFQRREVAWLLTSDIRFECQKHCRFGIIDLFLPSDPPSIIELKAYNSQYCIRQAIGQLAFYASEFPGAQLYIGTPDGLDAEMRAIITQWGISEWTH